MLCEMEVEGLPVVRGLCQLVGHQYELDCALTVVIGFALHNIGFTSWRKMSMSVAR